MGRRMSRSRLASLGTVLVILAPSAANAAPNANDASSESSKIAESFDADATVRDSPQLRTIVVEKPQAPRGISHEEDSATTSDGQSTEAKSGWYGWQTLFVDGLALTSLMGLVANDQPTPVYVGMGAYTVGAPTVHFANGEVGRGIGSLALRAMVAPFGIFAYRSFSGARRNCEEPSNEPVNCGYGMVAADLLGVLALSVMGGVTAFDAAVLARHDVPVKSRTAAAIKYVPNLALRHDAAIVSWGGVF